VHQQLLCTLIQFRFGPLSEYTTAYNVNNVLLTFIPTHKENRDGSDEPLDTRQWGLDAEGKAELTCHMETNWLFYIEVGNCSNEDLQCAGAVAAVRLSSLWTLELWVSW
jgi:hypothetical protein